MQRKHKVTAEAAIAAHNARKDREILQLSVLSRARTTGRSGQWGLQEMQG